MAFKFPFTNYHELNLTWVLEQLKQLFEESEENVETIETYDNRLSAVETEVTTLESTTAQATSTASAAATNAATALSRANTANENALTASTQAGAAVTAAQGAMSEAQSATQAAQQAQATAMTFDGRITQAQNDASTAVHEAESFENRVNAAINTANNAANTATIAQGIAVNANQNAATALDTAQTADGKAEAAQDAADIADGKAEAAQDAAEAAAESIEESAAQIAQNTSDISDLNNAFSENDKETKEKLYDLSSMSKPDFYHSGLFIEYPFPDNDFDTIGVKVFTDKRTFITDYNHNDHKNSGGRLWYFAPNGNDNNDGTAPNKPKRRISSITNSLANGDTIILTQGIYTRYLFYQAVISKSVNIIGDGNVVLTNADANYVYASEDSNTYSAERSNVSSVLIKIDENTYRPLKSVQSVDACKALPFSFYSASTTVYINTGGVIIPNNENVFLNLGVSRHLIELEAVSSNVNIYMENIVAIGGDHGGLKAKGAANYDLSLHAYKCRFLGSSTTLSIGHDAVSIFGAKAYFEECEASYARKDGFNYHKLNEKLAYGLEINCIGSNNGFNWTDNTANGTTCHDGCAVIRIGGFYHDNKGANIADVQTGTKTLNLRCVAFDSIAEDTNTNADFNAQQSGATMWLDCCKGFGSDWSVFAVSGTTMYLHNVDKETTQGGGTIDTTWNPYA